MALNPEDFDCQVKINSNNFPVWLRTWLISAILKPVLSHYYPRKTVYNAVDCYLSFPPVAIKVLSEAQADMHITVSVWP